MAKAKVTLRLPTGARRFEFTTGTSNKFYHIILEGLTYTSHWGRIGTDGAMQTKRFTSTNEARRAYDKQISEKLHKGYLEIFNGDGDEVDAATIDTPATRYGNPVKSPVAHPSKRDKAAEAIPDQLGRKRRKLLDD